MGEDSHSDELGTYPRRLNHWRVHLFGQPGEIWGTARASRPTSAVIDSTFQDLRYALRTLRRSPAFALTAILSLSLAIVDTVVYSILDAALLRPLPVHEPGSLFTLTTLQIQEQGKERPLEDPAWSYPVYLQFRAAASDSARLGPSVPAT